MSRKARLFKSVRCFVRSEAVSRKRSLARKRRLFEQLEDRKLLAGLLTYGDEDLLGFNGYTSDPKTSAILSGLTANVISDSSVQTTHAFPFVGNPSNHPGTDQIYVGSNQTRTRDGYSASSDRRAGPQLITMNYASLIPQGRSLNSLTLGIAADDFQFHQFGQAFVAKINGVTNDALTSKLNSLRQTGPITQFFSIGIDPRQLTKNNVLTLSIDSAGDGGDGWAIDFLTIGVQTSRYEVYQSSTKLADSHSVISLGAAGLGEVVAEKTFTVRNISDSPLTLQPISLPAGFVLTTGFTAGQVIAAGGSTTFSVRLDSTKAGDHRGILSFDTNDSENLRFEFELSGSVATNRGTAFWLAFQPNHPTVTPAMSLFIAGDIETSGLVSIPGANFSTTFTVRPGSVTEILLPSAVVSQIIPVGNPAIANASDKVSTTGIRVTSNAPVSVYGLNRATATTDGFLGLPTNVLGTEYIVLTYGKTESSSQSQQLSIVGISDNTRVTVTPSATIGTRTKGIPFNISLNAGQVYFLINTSTSDELSGTTISSSQNVAIFGGHTSAQVPTGRPAADHLTEQLPPVTSWASRFVTVPLGDQPQNLYRVLASANQTTIRINGSIVATINRGESYTFERTTASLIETSRPVLVAQFARGGNGSNLDPFMQIVPAIDQFSSSYTVATPTDTSFTRHFANLVVPNDKIGNISQNKVLVSSSSFTPIAGTNFSFAQLLVPRGTHQFESPGVAFGVTLYGWGPSDSYGYLGGQVFRQADIEVSVDNIALANGVGSVNFGSILVGTNSQKTFTVRNGTSVGELKLGQITVPNGFTLVSGPEKTILGPNESTTFVVGINTSSLGSRSGELTIANDDLDENPFRILLQGRIDTPVMEILDDSSQINNSSGSVNFGVTARGQPVTRVMTVRNTGSFELSLGTVTLPTNSGFSILSQPSATVAANGGQTTFQIRLDASTAGSRNTRVSISNSDPTKNPYSFDVLGFVYDNVDLVVTDIQTSPTSILGGQVDVNWTIRNQGTGEFRGSFSDNISISLDAQIGSDRSVGSFTFDGTLIAGQSANRTQRITLPSDIAGPKYVVVRTDASNQVFENNSAQAETNNVAIDDRVLNILAADLQPFEVTVARVLPTGTSTRVDWKVRNIGNAATLTGATWQDEVFLSTDTILDEGDTRLASVNNPSGLSEGGTGTDRYASFADVSIPYGVFGVRYVIVRSDSGTSIVELNEGNNVESSAATNITWQPPDLRVENVVSQAFAFSGAPTRISWNVRNVGRTAMLATEGTWRDRVYLSTDATLNPQQDRALGEFTRTGLLLPGEDYTQTVDVTMPVASLLTADDYFLIVETDWRNEVKEGLFEGNNWTSETSTTRVLRVPPPDLVVDSIDSIPASIFAGQLIDVSFRVKNSGAGDTEPSNTRWSDAVYLSTDGTLDGSDRLLGRIDRNGGLKKDDPPYQQSARFQIPSDLVGNHKLIVVTNVFGQVFGDDVTNNQRVTAGSIDIQRPPADLDVISVTPAASTVVVGSPLTVDYKVRNIGPQATTVSTWTDRIYLSRDSVLDISTDLLFDTVVRRGTLAASAEYQGSATKTVIQTGPFYVLVQSDAGNAVFEIVDSNNVQASSQQVNVVPTPADLTTSHIVVPSVARSGYDTSISYRVSNTGPNPTLGSNWLDRVYLSTDAVLDSSDRLLKSVSRFGALAAAPEFYEVTTTVSLPDGLTGQYHVIVHADAVDAVFEQDNLDNIAASLTKVTVVSQPADLVVTSILAAQAITVGQSLRLDWTVKNQGTGDTVVSSWLERVYLSDDNVFNAQTDSLLREFIYANISNSVAGPLEPGRSINRSEVVSFADNVLGDKFLFVVVDPTNVVFEPGAENNNLSVAQPIKLFPRDTDLQVTSVTAPVSAIEGVAFNVSWTVKNFGTAATNAAFWYDEVYVSTDNVLSANDVRLGSVRRSNPLSGTGQSDNQYSVTGSFAIPIGVTAGTVAPFFVLVKTDGGSVSLVPEKLENNNVTAASAATTVSPGTVALLPDLRITSVQAPTSVQVGQPITVNWSVQNTGPGNIVNGSWFDSVYLSLDQILDRQNGQNQSRDIFLGTKAQVRSMLKDATYSDSGTFTVPAGLSGDYFVLVATDFRNDIAEGATGELNNVGIGGNPLTVQPKAPADLVVGTITIPATGISGQSATISYTVANNGQNPAIGSWYDAVYISADSTWDVNDAMFGRVLHTGDVQPLGSYSESLTATLPGVLPGNYHVIIRSDIRNQIAESNEQNNLKATLDRFALDVTALTSGVPIDTNIGLGESAYFKIIVPANRTLGLSIDSASNTADTQLYVSKGTLPTQSRFDFSSNQAGKADHFLLVPDTEAATYYVLVKRVVSPGATPKVTVKADLIGFSLLSADVSRVGNSGSVTIAISGAQLRSTQSISLIGASPAVKRDASRFLVVDSSSVYATFDLTGLAAGSYSLAAVNDAAETATLASAINVEAARGGPAKIALTTPNNLSPGQTFQATLTVYNDGNIDAAAPLVQFDSESTLLLGYSNTDLQDKPLTVVVVPPDGFRQNLRPGQSIEIVVVGKEKIGTVGRAVLNVRSLGESEEQLSITPLLNSANYGAAFGSEAETLRLAIDSFSSGPASTIVSSLVDYGSLNLGTDVSYVDADYARRNQIASVGYLSNYVDIEQLSNENANNPASRLSISNAKFDIYPPDSTLNKNGKTHYIVAGFLAASPPGKWVGDIAAALKAACKEDNVIVVSWDSGTASDMFQAALKGWRLGSIVGGIAGGVLGAALSAGSYYAVAANRTEDLGNQIVTDMQGKGLSASNVSIIGHSLGAQGAGFAGQASVDRGLGKIGEIVGLDQAGLGFYGSNPRTHLESTDASSVKIVNTSEVFGRATCDGTENYYPSLPDSIDPWDISGAHSYAPIWYTEVLNGRFGNRPSCNSKPEMGPQDNCKPGERKFPLVQRAERSIARFISVIASRDPNDIIGPSGFGPENWITVTQPLNYTIRFENDPIFATAPAQRIEITQTLDSDLDARSFRLGDFGFGELFVDVPENRSFYSQRIDLRETKGIFVDVFAGINVATSEAFWTFIAVDPVTGDLPEDPLKGILPPNLNPPEGDGFVRYIVKAKAGVLTGTRVDAQARIVFDTNEPIDTPPIFNTLDAVTPTSQVAALDPILVANQARFPVKWSGSDDANGSAIQGFNVYVNVDGKGFQPWLTNVSYTDALYDGPVGASYAFYSVARDNAGNSEAAPVVQDTTITVVAPRDVLIEIGERTITSPGELVEFGAAIEGATAVQRTFTVRNSGNEPLVLGRASFTNGTGFTIVTNMADGLTLAPNAIASLVVRLDATAIGSKSSTMQFGTDVTGKSPFTLLLRGEVEPIPTLQMSVDIPTISEVGGTAIVTVTRNTSTTVPLTVSISSDIQSRLSFPATLTIPVGARSASFLIRAIDSAIAEGTQSIVISAVSSGMATGRVSVSVTDDEVPTLSLSISPSSISENGGTAIGTVSRNTPTTSALTVVLVASDSTEVSVSATVTIAAGASATSFVITAIADRIVDGSQQVMIAASSVGFTGGLTVVSVIDVDIWSWTNAISPMDVDDDNFVSPLDVLVLVNDLNQYGSRRLAPTVTKPYAYVDPDGDGSISPLDVLLIINHINSKGSGEGEGERSSSRSIATGALLPHALDVDAYFSALESDALVPSRRRRNR